MTQAIVNYKSDRYRYYQVCSSAMFIWLNGLLEMHWEFSYYASLHGFEEFSDLKHSTRSWSNQVTESCTLCIYFLFFLNAFIKSIWIVFLLLPQWILIVMFSVKGNFYFSMLVVYKCRLFSDVKNMLLISSIKSLFGAFCFLVLNDWVSCT